MPREMGEYMRKCTRIEGIAAMETTSSVMVKRRKLGFEEFIEQSSSSNADLHNSSPYVVVDSSEKLRSPATLEYSSEVVDGDLNSRSGSDRIPASCCSSNQFSHFVRDSLRSVDLEAEGFETENSTYNNNKFSRENTPLSKFCGDSDEMESSPATEKKSTVTHRRISPAKKMPSEVEIEEFFSATEKYDQKLFSEKYNYDVVKDVPLESRYEWIRLKP